jgi:hypothetical protein
LKKVVVGSSSSCKSSITYETSTKSPSITDYNMHTPKNHRTIQDLSIPLQPLSTNTKKKQQLNPEGK